MVRAVLELDRDGTVGKPRRHSTLDQINSLLSATEGASRRIRSTVMTADQSNLF
jgi:hypothetical protein